MNRSRLGRVFLVGLILFNSVPAFADLPKSYSLEWYLDRARKDMSIANYRACIESYEKALAIDPNNREALLGLARAYEGQGWTSKAVDQYGEYLARYPDDAETAFKLAQMLETDQFNYRREDAVKYYRMGLRKEDNPAMRARLARHLGSKQETTPEAIVEYEKLLQKEPHNAEWRYELAKAQAWQGDRETALTEARLAAKDNPDLPGLKEFIADLEKSTLASGSRGPALERASSSAPPEVMRLDRGRRVEPNPPPVRGHLKSVSEYQEDLRKNPNDAEAHYGLAQAYAQQGERDAALIHAREAQRLRPDMEGPPELIAYLNAGRRPQLGVSMQYFSQYGPEYRLQGFSSSLIAQHELTPAGTIGAEAGYARYGHAAELDEGAFVTMRGQYRLDKSHRWDGELSYHDLGDNAASLNTIGRAQYGLESGRMWMRAGFKRELKYDSFLSLAGQTIGTQELGAARSNLFFLELGRHTGLWEVILIPYGGWVKARSLDANPEIGTFAIARYPLESRKTWTLWGEYVLQAIHDEKDQSAIAPSIAGREPGGYFSPDLFINQTPRLALNWAEGRQELEVRGGPAIQYVKSTLSDGDFNLGGEGELSYLYHFNDHWTGHLTPGAVKIADVYTRFYVTALVSYTF